MCCDRLFFCKVVNVQQLDVCGSLLCHANIVVNKRTLTGTVRMYKELQVTQTGTTAYHDLQTRIQQSWVSITKSRSASNSAVLHSESLDHMKRTVMRAVKFPSEVSNLLKSYVYVYTDPRNGKPFYVGKGCVNRAFSHLNDEHETEKAAKIRAIRRTGAEPNIDILRYGLTDEEASLVEAAAIDLIGFPPLTNACRGAHEGSLGRISSNDLILMSTAKPVRIRHRAVLFIINKLYRSDMKLNELYEATRGIWKLGAKRECAEFAMAVYQGVVREVYRIDRWQPAGTAIYKTRHFTRMQTADRWEFSGEVATELRDQYVGKSVRNLLGYRPRNPVRYANI